MINALVLLIILSAAVYSMSYGIWARRENDNYRGAVGCIILAVLTVSIPVAVWLYHGLRD